MNQTREVLIGCTSVSQRFDLFFALKNITFDVETGAILGILGENGAGKTTLIRILAGLLKPTTGTVSIAGMDYATSHISINMINSLLLDQSFLYENLTVAENLRFYMNLHLNFDTSAINQSISGFVREFNLSEWINEPVRVLSKGMRRRIDLIRCLIHHPRLLLLDEPFSGLDLHAKSNLINLLKDLNAEHGLTVVLTTHEMDVVSQICSEVLVLKNGKIALRASDAELVNLDLEQYM